MFDKYKVTLPEPLSAVVTDAQKLLATRPDNHQVLGLRWMLKQEHDGGGVGHAKGRGMLVWSMGLGKTLMGCAIVAADKVRKVGKPTLVVCQASVLSHWKAEFAKHCPASTGTGKKRTKLGGPVVKQFESRDDADALERVDVVLVSYDLLKKEAIQDVEWSRVILDEVQKFKNEEAKRSEGVAGLQYDSVWALSGTPIKKLLTDWLGIGKALQLRDVPWQGNVDHKLDPEKAEEWINDEVNIQTILDQYCMIMKHEDAPRVETTDAGFKRMQEAVIPGEAQRYWMKICHDAYAKIRASQMAPAVRQLKVGKYQRPCEKSLCHPIDMTTMFRDGEPYPMPDEIDKTVPDSYSIEDSCKMHAIFNFYNEDQEPQGYYENVTDRWVPNGMIIFAEHVNELKVMHKFLKTAFASTSNPDFEPFLLDGKIKPADRLKQVFNHFGLGKNVDAQGKVQIHASGTHEGELMYPVDEKAFKGNIILGSLMACSEGLDYLKYVLRRVAWLQLPWTGPDMQQAEARVHRRGQLQSVTVFIPYVVDIPNHKGADGEPDPITCGKDHDGTLDQYKLFKIECTLKAAADGLQDEALANQLEAEERDPSQPSRGPSQPSRDLSASTASSSRDAGY